MKLDAVRFRQILFAAIILLIGATGGAYYYLSGILQASAREANHAKIDAELASNDTSQLQKLETQLSTYKDVIPRAKEIVASSSNFKYQDQVIKDITNLADSAGITITGYSFTGSATAEAGATSTPTIPGTAPMTTAAKKVTMTITVKSPLPYDSYLRFLRLIELNVTRLQVTGVNLTPDASNKNNITNPSIGIEIFVKG
jgi:hypothetical protein